MSANAPAAEAAAAAAESEVLDLNSDAGVVDSVEQAKATVADETEPTRAEAVAEPSMDSREYAEEGLDGEGRVALEDGKEGVVLGAAEADVTARPAADLVAGGHEALQEVVSPGGDVEDRGDRSGQSAETIVYQSTRTQVIEEKAEVAVEYVDGTEEREGSISLMTENKVIEESTKSNGVDPFVRETSVMDLDIPEGSVAEVDMGIVQGSDVVSPDQRTSDAGVVQSVESEEMCSQLVTGKPRDQGDVVVGDIAVSTNIESAEMPGESTLMAGKSTERMGDAVTGDSAPSSQVILWPPSQSSEDQRCHCSTQVEVSASNLDDRNREMGDRHEEAHRGNEKQASGGDSGAADANLAVQSLDQSCDPEVDSIQGDHSTSQVTISVGFLLDENEKVKAHSEGVVTDNILLDAKCVILSDSGLVPEESLPESSQPGQNLPSMPEQDPPEVSADPFLDENQSTEVQYAGSVFDGNLDFRPTPVAGEDVSSTNADLVAEHESTRIECVPSEEVHGQEVKLNETEDERVNLPSDTIGDEVAEADSGGNWKELNMPELKEEDKSLKCSTINGDAAGTENSQCASYHLPQEDKSSFSISDLVWGKVKSHPWWPGQIFDPLDASDLALKHQKKDNFLVAYFGDKTFAWCEESKLKPFKACFPQFENQGSSDAFVNAVNDALLEVSRQVELGMSCDCVPDQVISNLKHQKIENAGIREGSCCSVLDKSLGIATFQPSNFLDYIWALALYPRGGTERLELVIAKAQLMAFNRLKGCTKLPASCSREGLLENDVVTLPPRRGRGRPRKSLSKLSSPTSTDEKLVASDSGGKRKKKTEDSALHMQKHIPEHGRKEKSLSELMDDKKHSDLGNGDGTSPEMKASLKSSMYSSGKKHKNDDSTFPYSGRNKRKRLDALGDLEKKTPTPDRSFKVGECISRVASKLTGSPSIIKCNGESLKKDGTGKADQGSPQAFDTYSHTPENTRRMRKGILKGYSSPEEMLSQLCLAARDPMKAYSFLSAIVCFFTEVRELRDFGSETDKPFKKIGRKRGRKKKSESLSVGSSSAMDDKPSEKIGKKRGRKKKSESNNDSKADITDASTPDYMTDSYWTDRVVCSTPGEKSASSRRKRKGDLLMQSTTKKTKPSQESLPLSKMLEAAHHLRISAVSPTANRDSALEKQATFFGEKCLEESTPTALILSFNEVDALPSETNLIRIFSRYGPLQEAETEVLNETNCAKVVFKKRADAEVAFSSAGKYCIFGPALVSYRLRYLPSTPMTSPEARSDVRRDTETLGGVMGVNLETQAQEEAKEAVQEEVKGLAQEEVMESAQDQPEELTQEESKELTKDEAEDLTQEVSKELSQEERDQREVKKLAQEEVKGLDQKQAEASSQEEEKGLDQKVVEVSSQEEVMGLDQEPKELSQEELKGLDQEEANESAQDEARALVQEDVKESAQDEARELVQEEVKESAQDEARELVHEEAKESAQGEARMLVQEEVKESDQDETRELVKEEVKKLAQDETRELIQEETDDLAQEEVKESIQEETKGLAQGEVVE